MPSNDKISRKRDNLEKRLSDGLTVTDDRQTDQRADRKVDCGVAGRRQKKILVFRSDTLHAVNQQLAKEK